MHALILAGLLIASLANAQQASRPLLYASFDGTESAWTPGGTVSSGAAASDVLFMDLAGQRFAEGKVGQGYQATSAVTYPTEGAFDHRQGTVSLWFRPGFDGGNVNVYSTLFGVPGWGLVYKYTNQTFVTFAVTKDDGLLSYGCTASIAHWRAGQWRHLAVTWDKPAGRRAIYLDGQLAGEGAIPSFRQPGSEMTVGASPGGANAARGELDEVWIWDRPLGAEEIGAAFERTKAGRPGWEPPAGGARATAGIRAPSGEAPQLPEEVNWELFEAGIERTRTRVRIPLSGYWRFAAVLSEEDEVRRSEMGFLRVPGNWATGDPADSRLFGPDMKPRLKHASGKYIKDLSRAWYEREFVAPAEVAGRRLYLVFDSVRAVADVWVNGMDAGRALEFEEGRLDVSALVQAGETNRVSVLVTAIRPDGTAKGIDQDVWLEVAPTGPRLRSVGLVPSVTHGQLGVRAELEEATAGLSLAIVATGAEGEQKRLEIGLDDSGSGAAEWADARAWSPDDPYLYTASVALTDEDGQLLDELAPFNFGFREFEIRGGDLYLNGEKTHLRGQSSPPFAGASMNSDPVRIRQWLQSMKDAGANCVRGYSYGMTSCQQFWARDKVFEVADEMGMMFLAHAPELRNVLTGWQYGSVRDGYRRRLASYIRRYRNHPSVIMWQQDFNLAAHTGDIAPFILGRDYFPQDESYQQRRRVATEAEAMVHEIDPSRPVLHHASGDMGQLRTMMAYLGFGIPLQEREEWPSAWAARKVKPLMVMETGFPCILSYYKTRAWGTSLQSVLGSEPLVAEYAAMTLGEKAYELEDQAEIEVYDPARYGKLTERLRIGAAYQAQKAIWARDTLRSWRTYDMSGIFQHVELREGYTYGPWQIKQRRHDPRTPGVWVEQLKSSWSRPVQTTPLYESLKRNNQPLLAYIGGPEKKWVSKDHAFFPGERVEKSVVLINDRNSVVEFECEWEAELKGVADPVAGGKFSVEVQPGRTHFEAIEFEAPAARRLQRGRIMLRTDADQSDEFAFEVHPRGRQPIAAATVLVPGDGSTRRILEALHIKFSEWDGAGEVPDTKLLVIGRRAGVWTEDIEAAVATGRTRVVCFEQSGPEFAGFRLDDAWARDCFVAAPGHPLVSGLADTDFRSWRGDSDITEAYPDPGLGDPPAYPEEFWHWGNTNCMCTYPIEKPQRPGFTPLLSCEFDLLYTPLLQARIGKGHALFCQLDVSNRYGVDPVATEIVHRALGLYGNPGGVPDPRAPQAADPVADLTIVGVEAGRIAQALGLAAATAETMSAADCGNALARGEVVVLLGDADLAPLGLTTEAARVAKTDLTATDRTNFPGLSNSDLFWKRYLDIEALDVDSLPAGSLVPETGAFGIIPRGAGKLVVMRYDPFGFEDSRQRTKSLRVLSLLLNECGVSSASALSPYAEAALDFNPHLYRRW